MWYRHLFVCVIIFISCFVLLYNFQAYLSVQIRLLSYNFSRINKSIHHTAIILTKRPSTKVLKHLNALLHVDVNAYVMCDEQPSKYINLTNRILYVNDESLAQYGLRRNRVWDRVFVWLYNQNWINYVWLIEDDVTWSDIHHIVRLFDTYANNHTDLLSRNIIYKNNQTRRWIWWPKTYLDFIPETKWSGSLNMLSRVSRRLINAHQYYTYQLFNATKQKKISSIDRRYYYQEFFILTSARMFNLTIAIYNHSNMDVYVFNLTEDEIRNSLANGKQIFHPVKHDSQLLINATKY